MDRQAAAASEGGGGGCAATDGNRHRGRASCLFPAVSSVDLWKICDSSIKSLKLT